MHFIGIGCLSGLLNARKGGVLLFADLRAHLHRKEPPGGRLLCTFGNPDCNLVGFICHFPLDGWKWGMHVLPVKKGRVPIIFVVPISAAQKQ